MDPQLDFFLECALGPVQPTSPEIGRVVVEPDYDVSPVQADAVPLAEELTRCIREQSADSAALATREGFAVDIPERYPLLRKYIRSITLHQDRAEGAWVEVAPPGNWI
jgi:hypothetical protein